MNLTKYTQLTLIILFLAQVVFATELENGSQNAQLGGNAPLNLSQKGPDFQASHQQLPNLLGSNPGGMGGAPSQATVKDSIIQLSQLQGSNDLGGSRGQQPVIDPPNESQGPHTDEERGQDIKWLPQLDPNKIITFGIHILLALSGVYVCFWGFRVFRLLMIILGFYVSYYGILLALTELKLYKSSEIGHQMGLFFGCIILGFIISIMCYMLDKVNFVIFGMAIASVISLFCAQFFIDFKNPQDRVMLLVIYVVASTLFSTVTFFIYDHFIIWGAAFVGAVITPINIGVIFGDFKSFEDREKLAADRWKDLQVYLIVCGAMFLCGVGFQYYLRKRIIKRMQDSNLEEIRGTSFLN